MAHELRTGRPRPAPATDANRADGGSPARSSKDAVVSAPDGDGRAVLATVNCYDATDEPWEGALVEETSAFRSDVEMLADVHTLLWDGDLRETLDVRNDAVAGSVAYESPTVPEVHLDNRFQFGDGGGARLEQDVLVSVDAPALLFRNEVSFEHPHVHTIYTILGLGTESPDSGNPHAVGSGSVRRHRGYDLVVARDESRYLALAQRRLTTDRRRFDGARVGVSGRSHGPDRSAWADVYEENDGYIDDNEGCHGDLDAGVGLFVDRETTVRWLTAVGFGRGLHTAIEHAVETIENGYGPERKRFVNAWRRWHDGVASGPTGDPTADPVYERSLTGIKCAQDACAAMIAGAFKPGRESCRFVWPRDQVVVSQALLAAGAVAEARDALKWFDDVQVTTHVKDARGVDRHGTWWGNYYATGEPHWRGLPLDQVGGPIYTHWLTWQETGDDDVLGDHYDMSKRAASFLLEYDNGYGFPRKHQDPWEETRGYTTGGSAAAIAGLRCMADLAEAAGEPAFADRCRNHAGTWADNFDRYCYKTDTPFGAHYVTAGEPDARGGNGADGDGTTSADDAPPAPAARPDAAAFTAYWPWNVVPADHEPLIETLRLTSDDRWGRGETPCLTRYPGDRYTPTGTPEDGGWPLCEAYADVVRWASGRDDDAVAGHIHDHAPAWTTDAGLLPERVDGAGEVRWHANLQWSQATYVLLAESLRRGEPFGMAPGE